jgi:predicted DNA-binding transcriptional regulator AlpA
MKIQKRQPLSTVAEICEYLHIGKTTFYRLAATPGFPDAIRLNQRVVRYDLAKVLDFIKSA